MDTSAWFAAGNRKDRCNLRATELIGTSRPLLTTNLIVAETWLLFNARVGVADARSFWDRIRRSRVELIQVFADDLDQAWAITERFPDQTFSLIDCTSFVVMLRLGISRVISFDDFVIYRFGADSSQAFEVLR